MAASVGSLRLALLRRGAESGRFRALRPFATEPAADGGSAVEEKIPLLSFEELFFLHNSSLPSLKQRTFRGRVVASDKRSVYVDIGLHRLVRFPPHELKRSKYAVELYDSAAGGDLEGRWKSDGEGKPEPELSEEERLIQSNLQKRLSKAGFDLMKGAGSDVEHKVAEVVEDGKESYSEEVASLLAEQRASRDAMELKRDLKRREKLRVGDHIDLDVQYFSAYDGTITVEPLDTPSISTAEAVWNELQNAADNDRPIPGRILNQVNKGYAVGIVGIVAFLPESFAVEKRVGQVGVLQWFQVISLERESNNVLVRMYRAKEGR